MSIAQKEEEQQKQKQKQQQQNQYDGDAEEYVSLLDHIQKLAELERSLTDAIEQASLWLRPGGSARPLPRSMEDVHKVLCIARTLASRTSAPVGWNPQAPVIGFTTPNPMPHQLRGGALGTLQLEMARKKQKEAKQLQLQLIRKREREEQQTAALQEEGGKRESQKYEDGFKQASKPPAVNPLEPKRQDVLAAMTRQSQQQQQQQQRPRQPPLVADMNLSDDDSTSSDEE